MALQHDNGHTAAGDATCHRLGLTRHEIAVVGTQRPGWIAVAAAGDWLGRPIVCVVSCVRASARTQVVVQEAVACAKLEIGEEIARVEQGQRVEDVKAGVPREHEDVVDERSQSSLQLASFVVRLFVPRLGRVAELGPMTGSVVEQIGGLDGRLGRDLDGRGRKGIKRHKVGYLARLLVLDHVRPHDLTEPPPWRLWIRLRPSTSPDLMPELVLVENRVHVESSKVAHDQSLGCRQVPLLELSYPELGLFRQLVLRHQSAERTASWDREEASVDKLLDVECTVVVLTASDGRRQEDAAGVNRLEDAAQMTASGDLTDEQRR